MSSSGPWVVDTNLFISRLLLPNSIPAEAVNATIEDRRFIDVGRLIKRIGRRDFPTQVRKYITVAERRKFFELLARVAVRVEILRPIKACRDPKDGKFLEVAVNGTALKIVRVVAYLLDLHPYMGVSVLTPGSFLKNRLREGSGS